MSHPLKTPAVLYNGVSGECGKCGVGGESAASGQCGVSGESGVSGECGEWSVGCEW